jgi:hypothetical protein
MKEGTLPGTKFRQEIGQPCCRKWLPNGSWKSTYPVNVELTSGGAKKHTLQAEGSSGGDTHNGQSSKTGQNTKHVQAGAHGP